MITFHGSELCSAPHVGIGLGTSYLSWIDLVERHRPPSSVELLQQLAPLLRHRGFCTAMKAGTSTNGGWTVCLVEQVLVDGQKASVIIVVHLVRLLVN